MKVKKTKKGEAKGESRKALKARLSKVESENARLRECAERLYAMAGEGLALTGVCLNPDESDCEADCSERGYYRLPLRDELLEVGCDLTSR